MKKVWGFGTATIDFRIQTADYGDAYKEKLTAQRTYQFGGGSVANFLTQVARLGAPAGWLGKLGDDNLGRKITRLMTDEGIDCGHALYDPEQCSPFNLAVYCGPEMRRRCGFLIPNSLETLGEAEIRALASAISPGDYAMIEIGEIPLGIVVEFMRQAKAAGATLVVDVDLDPVKQCGGTAEQIDAFCRLGDVLMPNAAAMESVYPGMGVERIALTMHGAYKKPVVLSHGSSGAFFADNGRLIHKEAYRLEEISDAVGAGDAFHGGVVFALASGAGLEEAVGMGNVCGAMNCLAFGARNGMPTLEQAEKFKEMYKHEH